MAPSHIKLDKMKTTLVITLLAFLFSFGASGQGNPSGTFTNLPLYQGKKLPAMLNYSDIKGHYFYNENLRAAKGITQNGEIITISLAKLNLFLNEVHYLEDQIEYTASANQFKRLVLLGDPETNVGDIVLEAHRVNGTDVFFQLMNSGNLKLLKR
jgi:hypothetical protein